MKVKFRVKSKKVLAIILVAITVFCNGFKPTNTYAQESNSNNTSGSSKIATKILKARFILVYCLNFRISKIIFFIYYSLFEFIS